MRVRGQQPHLLAGAPRSRGGSATSGSNTAVAAAASSGEVVMVLTVATADGCEAEIEVYPADQGWCVPDSPAYDREQAERAWARLLRLYSAAL